MPDQKHNNALDAIVLAGERLLEFYSSINSESIAWHEKAVIERQLEIISEASRKIDATLKIQNPQISWRNIAGIGNILRHDYSEIDNDIIISALENNISGLIDWCKKHQS